MEGVMKYFFPSDLSIDEVRAAIKAANARLRAPVFHENARDGFILFNYRIQMPGSFPDPSQQPNEALAREAAILRECRGLCFDYQGNIIRRPYHKFFNLNEKEETRVSSIDWSMHHHILEKLDGSIMTPIVNDRECVWAIKEGWPEKEVPEFIKSRQEYVSFARDCASIGVTPIFEWCTPKRQIVVSYDDDNLILTAIRNNRTGVYTPYEAMVGLAESYGLPVVRSFGQMNDVDQYMNDIEALVGMEGHVIRFLNGHQIKTKGAWYLAIHKTKNSLVFEKDVFALVLSEHADDIKAHLIEKDRIMVEEFQNKLFSEISTTAKRLEAMVNHGWDLTGGDGRKFAEWVKGESGAQEFERKIIFDIKKGNDPFTVVRDMVAKYTSDSSRLEMVRGLVNGLRWKG